MHVPVGLELEEQAVGAVLGELGVERDGAVRGVRADGVDVRVGQLWGVQRDQVSVGPEVGLEVTCRLAVAGDAEGQLRLLPGGQLRRALVELERRIRRPSRGPPVQAAGCCALGPGAVRVVPRTYLRPSMTKSVIAR